MSQRPWYPFYPGDYLADTAHLTLEQHGAYHLLLHHQWSCGAVPESMSEVARILGVHTNKAKTLWGFVGGFFDQTPGGFQNSRMEKERRYVLEISQKRASAANKRWDASAYAKAYAPTPTPTKRLTPPKSPTKIEYPDWLDTQAWEEFVGERRRLGKKMSDLAQKKAINKLKALIDDGQHQRSVLDQSIANGWTGLFPVKLNGTHIRERAKDDAPPAFSLMGNDALASWADKMGTSLVGMSTEGAARHLAAKFRAT